MGADHSTARRINSHTIETTFTRNGKVVGTIRREVSADGRVLATTLGGVTPKGEQTHTVLVLDKQ